MKEKLQQFITLTVNRRKYEDVYKRQAQWCSSAGSMHVPGMGTITGNQRRRTGLMPGIYWSMEASCPAMWYGSQEAGRAAGYI